MDWACAAAYATSGLLVGDYSQGYAAFDYLIDTPGLAPVPDHLWRTLVTRVTPAEAYDMGLLAHQEGRSRRAAEALSRARRGGVAGADFLFAITLGDAGRLRRAAAGLAGITRRRENRLGPRHPGILAARAGRTAEALAAWESLAAAAPGHGPGPPAHGLRPGRTGPFPERRGPVRRGSRPAGPDPP